MARKGVIRYGDLGAHEVSKRFYGAVATEAALTTIPAADLAPNMLVLVMADRSLWVFDLASTATAAPGSVRATSGSGRFHIATATPSTSAGGTLVKTALAATTANLVATRVGNVLTMTANGALAAQDGVTLTAGQRLFAKDQTTQADRGIYELTTQGTVSTPAVLTRTADADESADWKSGTLVHVQSGTLNGDKFWFLSTNDPFVLNTTSLVFTKAPNLSELALDTTGNGADLIGAPDAATIYTATTVAGQLQEVKVIADAAAPSATLALTTAGNGAALIGIQDAATIYTSTNVETALAEVKVLANATLSWQQYDIGLTNGVAVINSVLSVAANSIVFAYPNGDVTGSTNFAGTREKRTERVPGGPGVGNITLEFFGSDGLRDTDASGTVSLIILTPQS